MITALATNPVDLGKVGGWLTDSSNWYGTNGLLIHLREHLSYTVMAVVIATFIALPLGLWIGHTGRGVVLIAGLANGLRAVPTLGFVVLLVVWISPKIHSTTEVPWIVPRGGLPYIVPIAIVLVLLAVPPILTNTYAGVQNVDPDVRDAARGMGMTESQIIRKVEVPIALPLIMSGLRSATLQVIATTTVAAFVPLLGGLGRLIIDGAQQFNDPKAGYPAMVGAGIIIAVLAVLADVVLAGVQRVIVSPGVSGHTARVKTQPTALTANLVEVRRSQG